MKISLNWLQEYVNLDGVSVDELKRAITFVGFEVEGVATAGLPPLPQVVVGEIRTRERHPNADKLSVCTVDVGPAHGGVRTIVCGAANCDPGRRVPVALPGAVLPGNFVIKASKIRGQASDGMLCAPDELGLGDDHAGLLELDPTAPIGAALNDVLPPGDTVFDLEVTPNRPDALCHLGIARELAAWFRRDVTRPPIQFRPRPVAATVDILAEVRVEALEDCPLYIGLGLAGVKVGPSPDWMQRRLKAVGLRPINNLVDVGNYVMLETGQPLHVFDARKVRGSRIVVRRAAEGEKLTTLDGRERTLGERTLVIADESRPLVVAGIMGGAEAEVDGGTTDIVLEAACFRPQSVRGTSRRLGLASDSSYRFERGVDPHGTLEAARRAVDLLLQTAGGRVAGPLFQVGALSPWSRSIKVTPTYIRSRLGFDLPEDEIRAIFQALQLGIAGESPNADGSPEWTVAVPSHRGDLERPIDLVEEVLRIHGTERVPAVPAVGPALVDGDDDPIVTFNRDVTDYLVGQHFHECVNYTLRPARELRMWGGEADARELALANPFVEDQSNLRPSLVPGLLESLRLNQSRGNVVSRLCETGRVFVERDGQVFERVGVGFVLAEDPRARAWLARPAPDFFAIKRHMEVLMMRAGLNLSAQSVSAVASAEGGWQPGQAAEARDAQGGWTACFGLLELARLRAAGIEGRVWAGMFSILPERLGGRGGHRRFQNFSQFPAALRDLALVADEARSAEDVRRAVLKVARQAASKFSVEAVETFDVYQGAGLPPGRKSLALSLAFRSGERTLTDEEVNAVLGEIQRRVVADGTLSLRT